MFGFLRLARKGLAKNDRALYNAHFCAACHGLAEFGGRFASFLTNYDHTFLLLVFSALDEDGAKAPERRACTAVPFRRVAVQPMSAAARPLLAALNIALIDEKLRDDVADEKRIRSRIGLRLLSSRSTLAHQTLEESGFPLDSIRRLGERQARVEASRQPCLTTSSTPTAEMLAEIFGFVARMTNKPQHAMALRQVGEGLGRFLYVWDAFEDVESDRRAGRFNAITAARSSKQAVRGFLLQWLRQMERGLDALRLESRAPLAAQLVATLRARVDARLPGETVSLDSLMRATPRLPSLGWLQGARHRAQMQRGDCDCDSSSCDCCSGCCDAVDCAACCSGNTSSAGCIILLVIIIVIVVIVLIASRHRGEDQPSTPPTTPAVTRSVSPTTPPSTRATVSPAATPAAKK